MEGLTWGRLQALKAPRQEFSRSQALISFHRPFESTQQPAKSISHDDHYQYHMMITSNIAWWSPSISHDDHHQSKSLWLKIMMIHPESWWFNHLITFLTWTLYFVSGWSPVTLKAVTWDLNMIFIKGVTILITINFIIIIIIITNQQHHCQFFNVERHGQCGCQQHIQAFKSDWHLVKKTHKTFSSFEELIDIEANNMIGREEDEIHLWISGVES